MPFQLLLPVRVVSEHTKPRVTPQTCLPAIIASPPVPPSALRDLNTACGYELILVMVLERVSTVYSARASTVCTGVAPMVA